MNKFCGNKWVRLNISMFQGACKIHDADYEYIKNIFSNLDSKDKNFISHLRFAKKLADDRFLSNMLLEVNKVNCKIKRAWYKSVAYMMYGAVRMLTNKYPLNN